MNRTLIMLLTALLASALALAACGADDESAPPLDSGATTAVPATTTAAAPPTAATQTEPAGGIDPLSGATTDPVVEPATNTRTALLSAVRAARHEGYDRVVFEFREALPGYDVRYVQRPLRQDGSGQVIDVEGRFVVQIRLENALDADLDKPSAPSTYDGPTRFAPNTPVIAELARTGGFEGVLTWVAGLRDRVAHRVTELEDPWRLVVDFANH